MGIFSTAVATSHVLISTVLLGLAVFGDTPRIFWNFDFVPINLSSPPCIQ